ncbi:unnamed protein product [Heterobilharzia americana]|nr:unnamed protein product [Heterobilharzia americana]
MPFKPREIKGYYDAYEMGGNPEGSRVRGGGFGSYGNTNQQDYNMNQNFCGRTPGNYGENPMYGQDFSNEQEAIWIHIQMNLGMREGITEAHREIKDGNNLDHTIFQTQIVGITPLINMIILDTGENGARERLSVFVITIYSLRTLKSEILR